MKTYRVFCIPALVLAFLFVIHSAVAQDPVKVAPKIYKVLLENDRVRVLKVQAKPGEKAAMHFHPAHIVYGLTGFKVRHVSADGKSEENDLKAGQTIWGEAVTHSSEIIGTGEAQALVIELKEPKKK